MTSDHTRPDTVLARRVNAVLEARPRSPGRRWALGTTLATRAFLAWVLASAVVEDSPWLFPAALGWWQPVIACLALTGILYAGLVALVQDDFKFVIGYSSVSHMGFVLLGLAAATPQAVGGAVLQMF